MTVLLTTNRAGVDAKRFKHGIVNRRVGAYKKYASFLVLKGEVKTFYQSADRPVFGANFPKYKRCFRVIGRNIGGKRIKGLLAGFRQQRVAILNSANAKRANDVSIFKHGVQDDVGMVIDLDRDKKAVDHNQVPLVVEGKRTAFILAGIYRLADSAVS